ncbi:hypothetical protein E0Z10_g9397 [Xylaria hypoxylon]|uniref:Uncharacterized protein n=1 Tax=Xylaria hypoxylon TaxID=37992 RepID=A0A4Z0Y8W5_9PEZI|nr:hypothetical protein E0Z10_g9397 [Xylaria hypoxylon]
MHDIRRDERVMEALEAAIHRKLYRSVSHAFIEMFRVAGPLVGSAHSQGLDLWDVLPRVQHEINWARNLPQAIFFELFTCLIKARNQWKKNPKLSHFSPENARLVREIDAFRRNVGDYPKDASRSGEHVSWILVDAVFFNELARGFDVDEDEGEDVEMQEFWGSNGDEHTSDTDEAIARITQALR